MRDEWTRISVGDLSVVLDPSVGNLRHLSLGHETAGGGAGRSILHTAHWVGTSDAALAAAPVDANLSGDFFCAPFGGAGIDGVPPHGLTANTRWAPVLRAEDADGACLRLMLAQDVQGARVSKELRLIAGHPALYQRHVIDGGEGPLTYAHHPMLHIAGGAHIGFSPKRAALTPSDPLEPDHHLAYPARSTDLAAFPSAQGGTCDLHDFPLGSAHEDFVTLIEADGDSTMPGGAIGWTAVTRFTENDIILFLKDPKTAPVTMLWQSNGGRAYAPWNGRHVGVLGVEDGCAAGAASLAEAAGSNPIAREGVATTQTLMADQVIDVRHAIVAAARPKGWRGVAHVGLGVRSLTVTSLDGDMVDIAFDTLFFRS